MHQVTKKGFKSLTEKSNDVDGRILRLIIDTVSSKKPIYNGIDKTIAYSNKYNLFKATEVIIPLQNGTEMTQKIFPEFLIRDLDQGGGSGLHAFYKKHTEKIKVVGTPDSDSYRYFFAHSAIKVLSNNESLLKQVAEEAADFWKEYYPEKKSHTPEFYEKKFEKLKTKFFKNFDANFSKNFGLESSDVTIKEFSEINEKLGHRKSIEDSRAVQGKEYFKDMRMSHKVMLQAMYSNAEIFMETRKIREFVRYETDRGERSIENHLFEDKVTNDKKYFYLIITDDAAARDSIHNLKEKTASTVYVLSSVGLATSLKFLGIINEESKVAPEFLIKKSKDLLEEYKAIEAEYKATGVGPAPNPDNILNPEVETKYAIRCATDMKYYKYQNLGENLNNLRNISGKSDGVGRV